MSDELDKLAREYAVQTLDVTGGGAERWRLVAAYKAGYLAAQPTAALRDVAAERARQQSVEGWTPEHDDEHDGNELARAASSYLAHYMCRGYLAAKSEFPTWACGRE